MKKSVLIILAVVLLVGGYFAFAFLGKYKFNNVQKEGYVYIPTNASFEQVIDSISPYLKNKESFKEVALQKNLNQKISLGNQ